MMAEKRKLLSRKGTWGLFLITLAVAAGSALMFLPHIWYSQIHNVQVERERELRLIETKLASAASKSSPVLADANKVGEMFLQGTTQGTAIAEFQTLLNTSAMKTGMIIERLQPLQTETRSNISILNMEIVAAGSLESLSAYLLAIEAGLPIVFITDAEISPQHNLQSSYPSESLKVNLRLQAFQLWEPVSQ